jgi:hypothetical protein
MLLQVVALAAALGGAPAAQDSAPSAPAAATAAAAPAKAKDDDMDKIVCKSEPVTGSRFTKRVCMTKAERLRQQQAKEQYEHLRDNATGLTSGPSSAFSGQ